MPMVLRALLMERCATLFVEAKQIICCTSNKQVSICWCQYVDDLIILANNVTKLKWLKSELEKKFEMNVSENYIIA